MSKRVTLSVRELRTIKRALRTYSDFVTGWEWEIVQDLEKKLSRKVSPP